MDWSSTNVLAVGLSKCVYLWEANNSRVQKLCDLNETLGGTQSMSDSVTSVGWLESVSLFFFFFSNHVRLILMLDVYIRDHTWRLGQQKGWFICMIFVR